MAAIGGAELQQAYWLLVVLLLLSFAHSHRSLLGLYVNCVRETDIWLRASLLCPQSILRVGLTAGLSVHAGSGIVGVAFVLKEE